MNHNLNQKLFQMTLRGLPFELIQSFKKEAKAKKMSLNQVLLERLLPPAEKSREGACAELMDLAGTWDEKRARDFSKSIQHHRKIDEELWK